MYFTIIIVIAYIYIYIYIYYSHIIKLFNCLTHSSCSETVYVLLFLLKRSFFNLMVPLQSNITK